MRGLCTCVRVCVRRGVNVALNNRQTSNISRSVPEMNASQPEDQRGTRHPSPTHQPAQPSPASPAQRHLQFPTERSWLALCRGRTRTRTRTLRKGLSNPRDSQNTTTPSTELNWTAIPIRPAQRTIHTPYVRCMRACPRGAPLLTPVSPCGCPQDSTVRIRSGNQPYERR